MRIYKIIISHSLFLSLLCFANDDNRSLQTLKLFNPSISINAASSNNIKIKDKFYINAIKIINGDIETFTIKKPLEKCNYSDPSKKAFVKKAKNDRKEFIEILVPNYKLALENIHKSIGIYSNVHSAAIGLRLLKTLINYKNKQLDPYYLQRLTKRYKISKEQYYKYFNLFTSFLVEHNNYDGYFTMGEIYEYGINQTQNNKKALKYYKKAIKLIKPNTKRYFDLKVKLQKFNNVKDK